MKTGTVCLFAVKACVTNAFRSFWIGSNVFSYARLTANRASVVDHAYEAPPVKPCRRTAEASSNQCIRYNSRSWWANWRGYFRRCHCALSCTYLVSADIRARHTAKACSNPLRGRLRLKTSSGRAFQRCFKASPTSCARKPKRTVDASASCSIPLCASGAVGRQIQIPLNNEISIILVTPSPKNVA